MKKIIVITALIVFAGVSLFAQTGAEYCSQSKINYYDQAKTLSKASYPGDSKIDITYYKLNLDVNYDSQYLTGIVTVKGRPVNDGLNNFFLDLWSGFTVNSVITHGQNLQFNIDQSDHLNIILDKSYNSSEEFSVDIFYQGTPTTAGGIGGSFVFGTSPFGDPLIWTLSQPYGSRDWWPSKDTPGDKADSSDVWITAKSFFVSVSNGTLTEVVNNNNGTKTYKWHNSYPISNYLISIAMSNYALYQNNFDYESSSMPITNYVYPGNLIEYKNVLDLVPGMLNIFSSKFGLYPFSKEKYGHAECGFSGGMEHQTCTSLGVFDENIIAHELAHQWFGDKVTCKDWNNIWLNEGFASYAECIYREAKYGKEDFDNYVSNFMEWAFFATGSIYIDNSKLSNVGYVFSTARTYRKGAIILHMLRGIIGDDKFFQTLTEYAAEPGISYGVATTEDFQRIAERVSGQDLNYFFSEWIYGEEYPQYTFGWNYKHVEGDNYTLVLRVKQEANKNPQFFTMPIQVKYTTASETKTITVFNDLAEQGWEIPITGMPTNVQFDPDNWILKKVVGYTNVEDDNNLISNFKLEQNYPNPFNPSTTIKYSIPIGASNKTSLQLATIKIYDLLGREIKTLVNDYKLPGNYEVRFDGNGLVSGTYFYRLQSGSFSETKKFVLMK